MADINDSSDSGIFPRLAGKRKWADMGGIVALVTVSLGGLSWCIKLESRLTEVTSIAAKNGQRIDHLEVVTAVGVLPVTGERLRETSRDIDSMKADIKDLRAAVAENRDRLPRRYDRSDSRDHANP